METTLNLEPFLKLMAEKGGSDLFFSTGTMPAVKIEGEIRFIGRDKLMPGQVRSLAYSVLTPEQIERFEDNLELNLALSYPHLGRFRVNIFVQRGEVAMVIRFIKTDVPDVGSLSLPDSLNELITLKTGLILVVGATGSGKSTTLASMVEHRNLTMPGHILTIEDPMEFAFSHKRSIVNQREVGMDTLSYANALKEAMREAPDVIMIGEIRDKTNMEHALAYADTGHLCLSTLHATNSNQALDRIIRFFPPEARDQLLMDLSLNLRAIISQRLIPGLNGKRVPAVEIMLNTPFVQELIRRGRVDEIKAAMEQNRMAGMQTFDQSLHALWKSEKISREEALRNADSKTNLEWRMSFGAGMAEEMADTLNSQAMASDGLGADTDNGGLPPL
ncbi:MAG: PilT/PilU family type 4a pilus ATPase [Halothiobacillaceae bacterium]|jgi:twitching motility protein PilU|nr:PilT/PilU family type 4a pilus ATPase [Halothiobacillaceae bacterium]MDY0050223.1 PilT/PilU family type 4a pilus ATPase [Halothiobacillaceae bacterium]